MRAYLFKTDNSYDSINPENGEDFSLEELQTFVGGHVETIVIKTCRVCGSESTMIMVVNEEGRLLNLKTNYQASAIAKRDIVGNALYCPETWIK